MIEPPAVRIVVLTDVDWASMTREEFAAQSDPNRPLLFIQNALQNDMLGAFRDSFGVDYFQYRREVRRIAQRSLESVKGAQLSIGFADFERWFYDDRDEFLFPTDDDDLYHPELARALGPVHEDTVVILWDTVQAGFAYFDFDPICLRFFWPALGANNWAIRKSFLREHFDAASAQRFLSDQEFAQRSLVEHFRVDTSWLPPGPLQIFAPLSKPGVVMLSDCYSVNTMHPGSLVFFGGVLEKGAPRDVYPRYNLGKSVPLEGYVSWAEPYVRELYSIIARLRRE